MKQNFSSFTITNLAYLGPLGTYSYQAAKIVANKNSTLLPYSTIGEVFDAVSDGKVEFGIVPSENLIEGVVKETLNGIIEDPIFIISEIPLPISHALLSKEKTLTKIKVVKSHPQALGQCRKWLKKALPKTVKLVPVNSTVSAVNELTDSEAMIAPENVAQLYNLEILAKNIGDNKNNQTNFYLITNQKNHVKKSAVSKAILFLDVKDRVGVLRDILSIFADRNLNLSRIISIPTGNKSGEYYFLIDVQISGKINDYKISLNQLKKYCKKIKILGEV